MMRGVREALRERRLAAEGLANACLAHIHDPVPVTLKLAVRVDPNVPADWSALLLRLDD